MVMDMVVEATIIITIVICLLLCTPVEATRPPLNPTSWIKIVIIMHRFAALQIQKENLR